MLSELYIFSVNSTLKGLRYGILSRLRFQGKAVGYWQELLTPIGRIEPKVEAHCVNQILVQTSVDGLYSLGF